MCGRSELMQQRCTSAAGSTFPSTPQPPREKKRILDVNNWSPGLNASGAEGGIAARAHFKINHENQCHTIPDSVMRKFKDAPNMEPSKVYELCKTEGKNSLLWCDTGPEGASDVDRAAVRAPNAGSNIPQCPRIRAPSRHDNERNAECNHASAVPSCLVTCDIGLTDFSRPGSWDSNPGTMFPRTDSPGGRFAMSQHEMVKGQPLSSG